MDLKFIVNDYVLIWNLLFRNSISANIHKLKQKLWNNYKQEYNNAYMDCNVILSDPENFIPNDDTIYNIIIDSPEYVTYKKKCERHRKQLLELWDQVRHSMNKNIKDIFRIDFSKYNIYVICPEFDVIDIHQMDKNVNNLVVGYNDKSGEKIKIIIDIIYKIISRELSDYNKEYKKIVQAILELAVYNELPTRITDCSHYLMGDVTLGYIKRSIYPYWLMYLGVDISDMNKYMMRDKIAFDTDKYTNEKQLSKVDFTQFIDFCIRNQKYIVKDNVLELV